jgi:hypothetical protein
MLTGSFCRTSKRIADTANRQSPARARKPYIDALVVRPVSAVEFRCGAVPARAPRREGGFE